MRAAVCLLSLVLAAWPVQALTVLLYAHADAAAVDRARQLARAYDRVWLDRDLQPGEPWRPAIGGRICRADLVLVAWSQYAAGSVELASEWRTALSCSRRVVPLLLDGTPLPPDLAARQAINWSMR